MPVVYAAESGSIQSILSISPVILKVTLDPGSKQLHLITVDNRTDSPMPIKVSIEGFDPSDEESGYSAKPNTDAAPLSQWISIDKPESIIPAKASRQYWVKISVPSTVPIGGYYAIIYFSPIYPGQSVSSKIGVVALANIGVQDSVRNKATISHFSFDTPLYEKNPLTVHIRVTNDALHYFSAKPRLTISPLWGSSDSVDLDEKILLPGKSRSWNSVFAIQNSKWGIYQATLSVSLENGDSITKTIPVAVLPIRLIGLILFLLLFVAFILKKRKNIKNAFLVLIQGSEHTSGATAPNQDQDSSATNQVEAQSTSLAHGSRPDPRVIIETVHKYKGSISEAAAVLRVNRSTVYRWMQRAGGTSRGSHPVMLRRKSTKPHTTRTSVLPPELIRKIIHAKQKDKLTSGDIIKRFGLSVSTRTIHRILKTHHLTRRYKKTV